MSDWKYNLEGKAPKMPSGVDKVEVELFDGITAICFPTELMWHIELTEGIVSGVLQPEGWCIYRYRFVEPDNVPIPTPVDPRGPVFELCRWVANNKPLSGLQRGEDKIPLPMGCRYDHPELGNSCHYDKGPKDVACPASVVCPEYLPRGA